MKEKQKIDYSVWSRLVDGIYTCKDVEQLLVNKKIDLSDDFDKASSHLWRAGEELSSSSLEEWISNEQTAFQLIRNYEDKHRRRRIALYKKWGSIAAAILLCFVLGVSYFSTSENVGIAQYEIHVPYGKRQKVELPDGTKVILNAGSYLKYPGQFGKENRCIQFKGEAYFDVAKNENSPFIIQSQDYKVHVLGTTFNLNNYEDSEELQLTLCTGKVLMNFGEEQLKLTPGEQLVLDKTNMHLEREHVNTQNYMLWMQNKLYFNRTPIQEVVRRLERVYNCTIQLDKNVVFNNLLSGTHDNKNLEAVLKSIRLATGIKYKKENGSYILYK